MAKTIGFNHVNDLYMLMMANDTTVTMVKDYFLEHGLAMDFDNANFLVRNGVGKEDDTINIQTSLFTLACNTNNLRLLKYALNHNFPCIIANWFNCGEKTIRYLRKNKLVDPYMKDHCGRNMYEAEQHINSLLHIENLLEAKKYCFLWSNWTLLREPLFMLL